MKSIAIAALLGAFAVATAYSKDVGQPAPGFTARNLKGESVSLADHKGKVVVLEWVNFDCPFVKKHYASGNMSKLQESYREKDVVWLTVCSSAEGKQGHAEDSKQAERASGQGNKATHFIADTDGKVGKAYDAKVTPHMFIINKEGTLVYSGAMDSKPTTDQGDIQTADKYFVNALDATLAGEPVENAMNQPYGCGIKY